jgi:hypothetical protein
MKISSILIILLALLIGILPLFFNCQHDGKMLTLENGKQIPMKCYWTARSSAAMGVILLVVGIALGRSHQRETQRVLNVLGMVLGTIIILFPTWIIGVCSHPDASCDLVMKPALVFMGSLVVLIGLVGFLISFKKEEQSA